MNRVLFSSASDHWATPPDVRAALDAEFNLNCDPCPLHADFDALQNTWNGRVFCNPPYSNIAKFLAHGLDSLKNGAAEILVYLLPARTDTRWFHDFCMKANEIRFLRGRLKFGGAKNSAPFPSMIVIFKAGQQ